MTIDEYLDAVKERLLTDKAVSSLHVIRERITTMDGLLRARLTLSDDSQIEFSKHVSAPRKVKSASSPTATTGPMPAAT